MGLVLILIGMGLMVAEVFVTSFGVLFTVGIVCVLVGGTMVFDMPEVSDLTIPFWSFLVPVVGGFATAVGMVVMLCLTKCLKW